MEKSAQDSSVNTQLKFHLTFDEIIHRNNENELMIHIMSVTEFLNNHPFPHVVTSTFGRLADIFVDCSNLMRLSIAKTVKNCRIHIKMITKFDDMASKFFRIIYSTDPIDRCAVLLVFSAFANHISISNNELDESDVHVDSSIDAFTIYSLNHQILTSLSATDDNEFKSAIIVAYKYAKSSAGFAMRLFERIPSLLEEIITDERLELILRCYSYMYHSSSLADNSLIACLSYSKRCPIGSFRTYTKLIRYCPWMFNEYFFYFMEMLSGNIHRNNHACALLDLGYLAKFYSNYFNENIVLFLFESYLKYTDDGLKMYSLFILHTLAKNKVSVALKYFNQFLPQFLNILSKDSIHLSILIISLLNYTLLHKYQLEWNVFDAYLTVGAYLLKFLSIGLIKEDKKLTKFCSSCMLNFLSHSPADCLAELQFSHICINNLFAIENRIQSSKIYINFLYIIHIKRQMEMDIHDFKILVDKIKENFITLSNIDLTFHFRFIFMYINIFSLTDFDLNWLLESKTNNRLQLYRIAVTASCCNLHEISKKLYSALASNCKIYSLSIVNYFKSLSNISHNLILSNESKLSSKRQFLSEKYIIYSSNNSGNEKMNQRRIFQNNYLTNYYSTLKYLRLVKKKLLSYGFELSNFKQNIQLTLLIEEISNCINAWKHIAHSLLDADIFSFNLINFYIEILLYLINLLKNTDNISYDFNFTPIHPHCIKIHKLLIAHVSEYKDTPAHFIDYLLNNILLKSWPLPLYFFKSQSYTNIQLNIKLNDDKNLTSSSELTARINEYFMILIEGVISTFEKNIKRLDKISKVVINVEYFPKSNKPKAEIKTISKIVDVIDGYFNQEFSLQFEKVDVYSIKVSLTSIIDKNDYQWNRLQQDNSIITVKVV